MSVRFIFSCLLLLAASLHSIAQQTLKGKLFDERTDSVLAGVTIYNTTRNAYTLSGSDGAYSLSAAEGDKVVFSSIGYKSDTVKVIYYMFQAGYDVTLAVKTNYLKTVTVTGSYQSDSIRRRQEYADIFTKPKSRAPLGIAPKDGVGLTVNPVIFQSDKEKQKKKLKKMLIYEEEQSYVDYSFSKGYVERITGLHGDSLQVFMLRYRPSYAFCRTTTKTDMLVYINDKLILFRKDRETPFTH